ncbi:hypothetical protein [Halorubrum halophilum]|uniref:hypothetical protein n=1 Tax=Halorubrum halophilum TaxID=413816 RepID=UPI00186B5420|nr:hypothetical protein [Halorubrum halophilum]
MERLSNGSRVDVEYRQQGARLRSVGLGRGHPIFENGDLIRSVGFARDITDQKTLKKRLREQNKWLSALTDNIPVSLFELDSEGCSCSRPGVD